MADHPSIPEYFKNKTILLTGVTGFLGKVVLETLLYTCPEIEKVYVLIRAKKGKSPSDRLDFVLSCPLFSKVQEEQPNFKNKVIAINADLLEDRLGLSLDDRQVIIENTEVVINAAACVNFSEPLGNAIKINLVGTDEVIKLCKEMPNIEVLCHVSTAFSNCNQKNDVLEKVYPAVIEPKYLINLIKWMPNDLVDKISTTLRKDFANNYVFTKQAAEYLVQEECTDFPSCIFRPPMLCPAMEGRIPGWIDNYTGIAGLTLLASSGVVRITPLSEHMRVTFCPVDHAANVLVALTWKTAIERKRNLTVLNFAKTTITLAHWTKIFEECTAKYPIGRILRSPRVYYVVNKPMYHFWSIIYHWIPAYIVDSICVITGYPRWLVRLYKRYHRTIKDFVSFMSCKAGWKHDNLEIVANSMSEEDKLGILPSRKIKKLATKPNDKITFENRGDSMGYQFFIYNFVVSLTIMDMNFPWTLEANQLVEHGMRWARGVKIYLLKEDIRNTDKCIRKQKMYAKFI